MSSLDPATLPPLTINLEYGDSDDKVCHTSPVDLYKQFTTPHKKYVGYGFLEVNVSVLVLPGDIEREWWGSPDSYWMRQKVRRAIKLGYEFAPFEHNDHLDELHDINTSMEERQGRPMTESYRRRPDPIESPGDQTCPRHRGDYVGVFNDGKLYAYSNVLQCGEMMMFSRILGHGDHMENGIMNLLVYEAAKLRQATSGTTYAVYYVQDSGTPGLQFFKRKMGFAGYQVRWELARPGVATPALTVERPSPAPSPASLAGRGESARRWWLPRWPTRSSAAAPRK